MMAVCITINELLFKFCQLLLHFIQNILKRKTISASFTLQLSPDRDSHTTLCAEQQLLEKQQPQQWHQWKSNQNKPTQGTVNIVLMILDM